MPALASNVRSLLHRFTLHAAIFPRRHRTRTNRMRALFAISHVFISFNSSPGPLPTTAHCGIRWPSGKRGISNSAAEAVRRAVIIHLHFPVFPAEHRGDGRAKFG